MKNSYFILAVLLIGFTLASCNDGTSPNDNNNNNNTTDSSSLFEKASGTVTLSMRMIGSKTTSLNTTDYTKSEDATVNLSFSLSSQTITNSSSGGSNCNWKDPYGGIVNWTEILQTTYDCSVGGRATDKETYVKSYSDATSGKQIGSVSLVIQPSGSYTLGITAQSLGTPTSVTHTIETNCGTPTTNTTNGMLPIVPFANDFFPVTNGMYGALTGTVDKANQSHLTGTYNGTDSLTVFDIGTTPIILATPYTITWDITRTN